MSDGIELRAHFTMLAPYVSSSECPAAAAAWFALRVKARSEQAVAAVLHNKGYDPYAPTYPVRQIYCDRVKVVNRPVFPGYLFCRFDPQAKFNVLNTAAVIEIVGFGGKMAPIADGEIDSIRRAVSAGAEPVPYLEAGQRVRIERGALAGLDGILLRRDGECRVVISIAMLQRSIAVHINTEDIRAVRMEQYGEEQL